MQFNSIHKSAIGYCAIVHGSFCIAGLSKKAYIEAVLDGVDSAIAECQYRIFVRYMYIQYKLLYGN